MRSTSQPKGYSGRGEKERQKLLKSTTIIRNRPPLCQSGHQDAVVRLFLDAQREYRTRNTMSVCAGRRTAHFFLLPTKNGHVEVVWLTLGIVVYFFGHANIV